MTRTTQIARTTGAALAVLLLVAACSSDGGATTAPATDAPPTNARAPAATSAGGSGCDPKDIKLVQSGRGLENEYYVSVDAGSKAFADSVGLLDNYQWIASDGDSQKQLSQITSILAQSGACTVLNVDPNESAILPAILDAVVANNAWLTVQWNRPEGTSPQETGPNWVAFMSEDGFVQGHDTAKALFEAMGGTGGIVALQGILDNTVAQSRFAGLQKALEEYPDIKLLGDQTAKWDRTEGQNVMQTFLTKFGDEITGVWAGNDAMGLGAVAANEAAGKKIPVSGIDGLEESLKAIAAGDGKSGFIATTQANAANQGGFGLAIAYAAATGEIDPTTEPDEHRAFFLKTNIVTKANVADIPAPDDTSKMDFSDIWSVVGAAIP